MPVHNEILDAAMGLALSCMRTMEDLITDRLCEVSTLDRGAVSKLTREARLQTMKEHFSVIVDAIARNEVAA